MKKKKTAKTILKDFWRFAKQMGDFTFMILQDQQN